MAQTWLAWLKMLKNSDSQVCLKKPRQIWQGCREQLGVLWVCAWLKAAPIALNLVEGE